MAPVRVKYCGLVPITRPTYLRLQFLLFLICVAMIVVGLSVMLRTQKYLPHVPDRTVQDDLIYQALIALFWLGVLFLLAGIIETIVMLRKFSRAAAQQKASLANIEPVEPALSPPGSTGVQPPASDQPTTNPQP